MNLYILYSIIFIFLDFLTSTDAACTFPASLQGTWEDSFRGKDITIGSSSITSYVISDSFPSPMIFNCETQSGAKYVLKSDTTIEIVSGINWHVYTCFEPTQKSDSKYVYYLHTQSNTPFGDEPFIALETQLTAEQVCVYTAPTQRYYVLLKPGSGNLTQADFPPPLQGLFSYTVDSACTQSQLDNCADNALLTANMTLCAAKIGYSAGGELQVVHFVEKSDTFYITLRNLDSALVTAQTYRFSCWVAKRKTNKLIDATATPNSCSPGQTSTTATTTHQVIKLTVDLFCGEYPPPNTGGSQGNQQGGSSIKHANGLALFLLLFVNLIFVI